MPTTWQHRKQCRRLSPSPVARLVQTPCMDYFLEMLESMHFQQRRSKEVSNHTF